MFLSAGRENGREWEAEVREIERREERSMRRRCIEGASYFWRCCCCFYFSKVVVDEVGYRNLGRRKKRGLFWSKKETEGR